MAEDTEVSCVVEQPKAIGFKHSVSVPQLYKEASKILQQHFNKEGSLKTLIYSTKTRNHQRLLRLLSRVIDNFSTIEYALNTVNLFEEQPRFNKYLAFILTSEMMKNNGLLPGEYVPALTLNSYRAKLAPLLSSHEISDERNLKVHPKYARINDILSSEKKVYKALTKLGYKSDSYDPSTVTYDDFLERIDSLEEFHFMKDYHIPNVLVFNSKTVFWNTDLYSSNKLILQNKASCMPAFVSGVQPGDCVIDACAAPGNKTTHLASLMKNEGRIIAIDRSKQRFNMMEKLIDAAGPTCIETLHSDFRDINPDEYPDVSVILVDPSCSSSGTTVHSDAVSKDRISALSIIQLRLLCHALSFPNVKTVIYSTCSVNEEENEQVVSEALQSFGSSFRLKNLGSFFPGWKHFGNPMYPIGKKCLRTDPNVDKCQGFFVAKFARRKKEKRKNLEENFPEKKIKKKCLQPESDHSCIKKSIGV